MSELTQGRPQMSNFSRNLILWADGWILWVSTHWLAVVNGVFFIFVGLPFLAPILLANGHAAAANTIYMMYRTVCHQLPARSYFIAGEQVAFCQRNVAIYASLLLGGLLFNFVGPPCGPPHSPVPLQTDPRQVLRSSLAATEPGRSAPTLPTSARCAPRCRAGGRAGAA